MKAPTPPCLHPEAFCLMWYGTGAGRVRIWNTRDGVTPFYIDDDRKHEDWHLDQCDPWHCPAIGDLVFIDLTLERATESRTKYVERWWETPFGEGGPRMVDRYPSKEEAVALLAKADFEGPGAPEYIGGVPDILTISNDEQILTLRDSARALARELRLPALLLPRSPRFA